jgi:hypothetical protein
VQENELRKLVSSSGPAASALEKFTAEKLENEIPDEKPATPESTEPVVENGLYSRNMFGMDDGYVVGPSEVVFPAVERFERSLLEQCGLRLQRAKTEVFTWDGVLPRDTPAGMVIAGREVEGQFMPGFLCYGVQVGSNEYVRHVLEEKVEQIAVHAVKVRGRHCGCGVC